jgi:hypothetical protein
MKSGGMTYRRLANVAVVAMFLVLLALPMARALLGPPPALETENRVLAPMPELSWTPDVLDVFPTRFEAYYSDRFGGRGQLIRSLHVVQAQWLQLPSLAKVGIGKKGWLFFLQEPVGQDYLTNVPFRPDELVHWQHTLEARRDWLARRGIAYVFLIAPDKQSVYPEVFPRVLRSRGNVGCRLDQLLDHLHAHADVPVLDLRGPLREAKSRERVYSLTDSHWNDCGAYVAYQCLLAQLTARFPAVRALPRSAFDTLTIRKKGGDLARMLALDDRILEQDPALIPHEARQARKGDAGFRIAWLSEEMQPQLWERADPSLPRAVVLRDSFAGALIPFLSEHFQRTFYLWQEPFQFDTAVIERERPDVVIQEIVERKLAGPFPPSHRAEIEDTADEAACIPALARGARLNHGKEAR